MQSNFSTTNLYIDSNFLSLFPMKTEEEFLSIEDKIVHKLNFVSKLVFTFHMNYSLYIYQIKFVFLISKIILTF